MDVNIVAARPQKASTGRRRAQEPSPTSPPARRTRPVEVFADEFEQMTVRHGEGDDLLYYGGRHVSRDSHDGFLKAGDEMVIEQSTWFVSDGDSHLQAFPYRRRAA